MKNIELITRNDLCVSCGICKDVCPYNNIEIKFKSFLGRWDPVIIDKNICKKCNGEKLCLAVCPNYKTNYIDLAKSDQNRLLGSIEKIYTGYSKDSDIRHKSSSGGFIKTISKELLESKQIDGVISIRKDSKSQYKPAILTSIDDMPNSIYHNVNLSGTINLLEKSKGKFMLIGTPCQLTAINKYLSIKKNNKIKEKIFLQVSLICGYNFNRVNTRYLLYKKSPKKIRKEIISKNFDYDVSYRSGGRHRNMKIKYKDHYLNFEVKSPKNVIQKLEHSLFSDRLMIQKGCLFCVDHIGYNSDITTGDAWIKKYLSDDVGTSIVICRTKKGKKIFENLKSFEFFDSNIDEVIESQKEYALGSIGESMKKIQFNKSTFTPIHKRTNNKKEIRSYKFSLVEIIKIKFLRELLYKRKFKLVDFLYKILNVKISMNYFLSKIRQGNKK